MQRLSTRSTVLVMLSITLTIAIFAGASALWLYETEVARAQTTTQASLNATRATVTEALWNMNLGAVRDAVRGLESMPEIAEVQIETRDKTRMGSVFPTAETDLHMVISHNLPKSDVAYIGDLTAKLDTQALQARIQHLILVQGKKRRRSRQPVQPHLPELDLQTRRIAEYPVEIGPAGHRGGVRPETLHGNPVDLGHGVAGNSLKFRAAIEFDPGPVGIAVEPRFRVGQKRRADLAVTAGTGRQRHEKVEQIPRHPRVEDIARVGHRRAGLRRGDHRRLVNAPGLAIRHMQAHLRVEKRRHGRRRLAHFRKTVGLVDRQGVSAGEVNQEEIILDEIVPEARLRQRSRRELPHEGVACIIGPRVRVLRAQAADDTFGGNGRLGKRSGHATMLRVPGMGPQPIQLTT